MDVSPCNRIKAAAGQQDDVNLVLCHGVHLWDRPGPGSSPGPGSARWVVDAAERRDEGDSATGSASLSD